MKIQRTFENVQGILKELGYELVEYNGMSKKSTIKDTDGYYYNCLLSNIIYRHEIPKKIYRSNSYSIDNIRNYMRINNIKSELLSTNYVRNSQPLDFKCNCGRIFTKSWANFLQGSTQCSYCGRSVVNKDVEKIQKGLEDKGLSLMEEINGKQSNDYVKVIDKDGYWYFIKIFEIYRIRENGKYDNHQKISSRNPFTIHNINVFLETNGIDYKCISEKYYSNTQPLKFLHNSCGTIFKYQWSSLLGLYNTRPIQSLSDICPCCKKKKTESYHAMILKQIFLHEYPDTIIEEPSCINPVTQRILPTDIVNHRLKIAIEIQSDFHDKESQIQRDKIKKEFWVSKGYKYFAPDIREYKIIDMVHLFFPNIKGIPDYVDYNFSNSINCSVIQDYLNKGYSIKEISQITNINDGSIRSGVTAGRLKLPNTYKQKILNWQPIVQLNDLGEYIKTYNTMADADREGYARGTVCRVLKGTQKMAYNSYWLYESDYLNNNYSLPELSNRFIIPVDKYDIDGNFIKSYPNIYRAEMDSLSNKNEIIRIINDPSHHSARGEVWKIHH